MEVRPMFTPFTNNASSRSFPERTCPISMRCVICATLCLSSAGIAWADGAVYAMSNALGNNEVLVYHRAAGGTLSLVQTIATGGGGSGLQLAGVDSLGSQGSLQLDEDHQLLFAVNTESASENNGAGTYNTDCEQGTITSFAVAPDGTLTFADRVFSGGLFPNSLTVKKRGRRRALLYVLNAGGPEPPAVCHLEPSTANTPNITGYTIDKDGHLNPVGSAPIDPGPATGTGENCSAASAAGYSGLTGASAADFQCGLNPPSFPRSAAQVLFSPDGRRLLVTVKGTNVMYAFPVKRNGSVDPPMTLQATAPALPTFSGMAFDDEGDLLVAELFGSATSIPAGGKAAVSSFALTNKGGLETISEHVGDGGTAAASIVVEPATGNYAYVSNNLSASISSYSIGLDGSVTLLNGTAALASGPNDLATAQDGGASFLYVVDAGTGTIGAFQINQATGALTAITGAGGLPTFTAQGLAAY
jgi:6-phosphogluconolactonase